MTRLAALLVLLWTAPAVAEPFDVAAWATALDPDRPAGGEHVVYVAAADPDVEAIDALRRSLLTGDPRLAEPAAHALADHGVPHGEAPLLELARSERWPAAERDVRVAVVRSLARMRSGRALPLYARLALQESGPVAREAIRALCGSMAPEAEPVLAALAGGEDPKKRNLVVRFLRRTGAREAAREARDMRRDRRKQDRRDRRDERRERRDQRREERGR